MPDQKNDTANNPVDEQLLNDVREQMNKLPQVVRELITSPELDEKLQNIAKARQLHIDKWTSLENQVILVLMGVDAAEDLQMNIEKSVGLPPEEAATVAQDISDQIFEPLRQKIEEELPESTSIPQPAPEPVAIVTPKPTPEPILPATPPAPKPEQKVERAPANAHYMSQVPSHQRSTVEGDPYREQIA